MLKFVAALAISALASVAHSQQEFDYQGMNMTGDSGGMITAQFQITGNTVNYGIFTLGENNIDETFADSFGGVFCLAAQNCTPSEPGRLQPFLIQIGLNNNAPPIFSVVDMLGGSSALLIATVGPGGDSLSLVEDGETAFSVANNTPGTWTLNGAPFVAAPEIDATQSTGAITLLAGCLLVLCSRQRATGSLNRDPNTREAQLRSGAQI
jgi:hypothetical protein